MTGALALPCPVYKYRGRSVLEAFTVCFGFNNFAVGRHVHIHIRNKGVGCCAWFVKAVLIIGYFYYAIFYMKEYLHFDRPSGIARMQLQHPVNQCNPLHPHCSSDFRNITELTYCKQNPINALKNTSNSKHIKECEFLDVFDIPFSSVHKTMFLPTRLTKYVQKVDCTHRPRSEPCPKVSDLEENSTVFVADVESYTLLIDHSFVSETMHHEIEMKDMLGFVNPCGKGKTLHEGVIDFTGHELKHWALGQMNKEEVGEEAHGHKKHEEKERHCSPEKAHFKPIHAYHGPDPNLTKKQQREQNLRNRGFAMWLSDWRFTLFPFTEWSFNMHGLQDYSNNLVKKTNASHFKKIKPGEYIKVEDILEAAHVSFDHPKSEQNRYDGMVIIIDIQYFNWKENSWPNRIPPAYFYSFWKAPANEYKMMHQALIGRNAHLRSDGQREILDSHGIFFVINQGGKIGGFSLFHTFFVLLGVIVIETLYRALFLCCVFNLNLDYGHKMKEEQDDPLDPEDVLNTSTGGLVNVSIIGGSKKEALLT
jgi:hypothetical protein